MLFTFRRMRKILRFENSSYCVSSMHFMHAFMSLTSFDEITATRTPTHIFPAGWIARGTFSTFYPIYAVNQRTSNQYLGDWESDSPTALYREEKHTHTKKN